jgi:hypothetical protein
LLNEEQCKEVHADLIESMSSADKEEGCGSCMELEMREKAAKLLMM